MGLSPTVLSVLSVVVLLVSPSTPTLPLCDYSQCNCTQVSELWIKAVCRFNNTQKQLDITPETLPRALSELFISGPREVVLTNGSFSRNLTSLSLVRLTDIVSLTVERKAFARLSSPSLRLEVDAVQRVILESGAFYELWPAIVYARLERVEHLVVQENAFDRLLGLEILRVKQLELQPNAFFYKSDAADQEQGPVTKITLDHVKVRVLPYNVFPALNKLHILHSEVGEVLSGAFRAIRMTSVVIEHTTLRRVRTEAFTSRAEVGVLRLEGVSVEHLEPNCLQAGITQLVVRGSSFTDVSESALNAAAAATVTMSENVFNRVRSRGFTLKETTMLTVENNRFNIMEDYAFVLPEGEIPGQLTNLTLTFRGNSLGKDMGKTILDLTRRHIGTTINNNSFDYQCQCEETTKGWLREKVNCSDSLVDLLYETSVCQVNVHLSRCFGIPQGSFSMENFTSLACDTEGQYYCAEVIMSDDVVPSFPGVTSDYVNRTSIDRERKVLGSIFVFVISGVVVMLFFSGFMWLRRNGYCTKARLLLLPSAESVFNIISRPFVGPGTATVPGVAVNRTSSGHEYAELQAQKLGEESAEEEISVEDKATQTLPEELTQELLQTLREKLDDPNNYGEARDMIEHLYDLIKVEESCNQNSDLTSLQMEELLDDTPPVGENVYDVIQPKVRTKIKEKKCLVSVGTRAPSPDKLLPVSLSRRKAVVCDYAEPKDRQLHVYQELPTVPSVLCDYTEPPDVKPHVYIELPTVMVNRPLPSKPGPSDHPVL